MRSDIGNQYDKETTEREGVIMQRRLSRIYKYWVKYNNRQRLSIRIIDAASQIQNLDPGRSSKNIISIIISGITFVMAMIAFGVERIEEAAKKSKIAHLTRYSKRVSQSMWMIC